MLGWAGLEAVIYCWKECAEEMNLAALKCVCPSAQ